MSAPTALGDAFRRTGAETASQASSTPISHVGMVALLWATGLLPILGVVTSTRFFDERYAAAIAELARSGGDLAYRSSMLSTYGLLGLSAVVILVTLPTAILNRAGIVLWLAVVLYGMSMFFASTFAHVPSIATGLLLMPLVATAIYLATPDQRGSLLMHVRLVILFYAYASLASIIIIPDIALQRGYPEALFPSFDTRLHGLGTHANNLAGLLVLYFAIELGRPAMFRPGFQWFNHSVVFAALVFTQSKTVWLAMVVVVLIHVIHQRASVRYAVLYSSTVFAVATALAISIAAPETFQRFEDNVIMSDEVRSFTGRNDVWALTIESWRLNPIFGYGRGLWRAGMALSARQSLGWVPPHAHNQFMQTLGQAGIVGAATFAVYVSMITYYAVATWRVTRGVSLALLAILVMRGMTEVPMEIGVTDNFFAHMVILAFLFVAARERESGIADGDANIDIGRETSAGTARARAEPVR